MIKAKRGLLIALFAAMMVFAFGATSAFASIDSEDHEFDPTKEANIEKYLVKPTCETPGYAIVKCSNTEHGLDCKATKNVKLDALGHKHEAKKITVTAKEYADELVKEGRWSQEYADEWMLFYGSQICTGQVGVCENCGCFLSTNPRALDTLTDPESFYAYASKQHKAPEGTKGCDASFTCDVCGQTGVTDEDHNALSRFFYHADPNNLKDGKSYVAHAITGVGDVTVTEKICKACGEVVDKDTKYSEGTNQNTFASLHTTTAEVVQEPTCTVPGRTNNVCTKCGEVISYEETPALGHHWVEGTKAATETDGAYKYEYCDRCLSNGYVEGEEVLYIVYKDENGDATTDWNKAKKEKVSLPIDHNITATLVAPKNCTDDTWVEVKCTNPNCTLGETGGLTLVKDEKQTGVEKIGDKYYFTLGGKTVEIPFEECAGHTWGEAGTIAEATCETKGLEGRTCTTCGAIYHETVREVGKALGHEAVVTVTPARCGSEGYTSSRCSTCGVALDKNGKSYDQGGTVFEWDITKPVVGYGVACTYEWKVLEEATPFALGTRAKVCTVCNHELAATKESIAKTTIAAPAVKAKNGKKAVVTVKAVEGAVSYQILVNGKVKVKNAKVGKNTVKKLTGKKAKVQVKAFDVNGVAAKSKAKTVKVKK